MRPGEKFLYKMIGWVCVKDPIVFFAVEGGLKFDIYATWSMPFTG